MASVLAEDGADLNSTAPGGGLGFDVKVFKQYLELLLAPGEASQAGSSILLIFSNVGDCSRPCR